MAKAQNRWIIRFCVGVLAVDGRPISLYISIGHGCFAELA